MLIVLSLAYAIFAAAGVVLSVIDLRVRRLPNVIVLPSLGAGVVLLTVTTLLGGDPGALVSALLGGIVLFSFYLVSALLLPSGVGMGDVKASALVGLYLGYAGWEVLFWGTALAFLSFSLVALSALALRRARLSSTLPFGPFLFGGAALALAVTLL